METHMSRMIQARKHACATNLFLIAWLLLASGAQPAQANLPAPNVSASYKLGQLLDREEIECTFTGKVPENGSILLATEGAESPCTMILKGKKLMLSSSNHDACNQYFMGNNVDQTTIKKEAEKTRFWTSSDKKTRLNIKLNEVFTDSSTIPLKANPDEWNVNRFTIEPNTKLQELSNKAPIYFYIASAKEGMTHWQKVDSGKPMTLDFGTPLPPAGSEISIVAAYDKKLNDQREIIQLHQLNIKINTPNPGPTPPVVKQPSLESQELFSAFRDCRDPLLRTGSSSSQALDDSSRPHRTVICVDAVDGDTAKAPHISGSSGSFHVIKPNTSVLVMVRHLDNTGVRISMGGQVGLTSLGYQNLTGQPEAGQQRSKSGEAASAAPPPSPTVSAYSFAPRKVGSADIRVQLLDRGKQSVLDELNVEVLVEQTYIGALRIGIGAVLGNAVDRAYVAQKAGGSGQYQLATTTQSVADPELVLGFAPFVLDAFSGGRRYSGDMSFGSLLRRLSPFFGVGVLTQAPTGIDAFKSFYFGGELELAPSFSIAVTGVLRRVTRPGEGLDIGSPLPDENVPTRTGYDLGWAVVVNLTPDFLRLSSTTVSSFLK
jgi:hypothetical protein